MSEGTLYYVAVEQFPQRCVLIMETFKNFSPKTCFHLSNGYCKAVLCGLKHSVDIIPIETTFELSINVRKRTF